MLCMAGENILRLFIRAVTKKVVHERALLGPDI